MMRSAVIRFDFAYTQSIYVYIERLVQELHPIKAQFHQVMVRNRFDVPIGNQIKDDIGP